MAVAVSQYVLFTLWKMYFHALQIYQMNPINKKNWNYLQVFKQSFLGRNIQI